MTSPATSLGRATTATAHAVTESVARVRAAAPGWVGGALAGIQAALFSFALVLIPVWVAAAAASDATVSWGESSGAAARMWLMTFGAPWAVNGVPVTLVPLGVLALTVMMTVQLARRFAAATWFAGLATVAAFAATVGVTTSIAWSGVEDTTGRVVGAVTWAVLLAAPAVAWGLIRQRGATMAWLDRIPASVRGGALMGLAMTSGAVVMASLVLMVSAFQARQQQADAVTALGVDSAGGLAFAFLETAYAPTLVVWTVSWLSGAGYSLGGVMVTSAQPLPDDLPAVPILWSLPHASGGLLAWSPVLFVVLGAFALVALRSRLGSGWQPLVAIGVGGAVTAAIVGAASALAHGAIGPGTLASVGPQPAVSAALLASQLALGAVMAWAILRLFAPRSLPAATATSPRNSPPAPPDTPPRTEDDPDE
ncbi:DUF6350 family protein [Demequina sp. TTPB684]|uniref:cell division protein PerM n=1 Tax=unclassified Demequina TaxID=2620311 RepID=UPI001CF1B180|nr:MULTISPECIES: DUF6350 family protein [unclassified Demequina]MCB2412276.1 DUF6350 family protein [Demequina sp. TTPB684]UPU88476.1 DUF6350 family protein [Demequina sp. TMPB413]